MKITVLMTSSFMSFLPCLAFAGVRIENRERIVAEEVLEVGDCRTTYLNLRPYAIRFGADVAVRRSVEVYQVEVKSEGWFGDTFESIIPGSSRNFSRIETKIGPEYQSKEACEFWVRTARDQIGR